MQLDVTGKASTADMTLAELGLVLDRLNKGRPAPMSHRPHVGKIRALWWTAYWLGAVEHPDDAALDAFIQRQTGRQKIAFLSHVQAPAVIEALKAMAEREGVRWSTDAQLKALPAWVPATVDLAFLDRIAVITVIWAKLREIRAVDTHMWEPYLERALANWQDKMRWTPRELDDGIKLLGKKLRRALDKRAID